MERSPPHPSGRHQLVLTFDLLHMLYTAVCCALHFPGCTIQHMLREEGKAGMDTHQANVWQLIISCSLSPSPAHHHHHRHHDHHHHQQQQRAKRSPAAPFVQCKSIPPHPTRTHTGVVGTPCLRSPHPLADGRNVPRRWGCMQGPCIAGGRCEILAAGATGGFCRAGRHRFVGPEGLW